jgi:hypothetical protein
LQPPGALRDLAGRGPVTGRRGVAGAKFHVRRDREEDELDGLEEGSEG